MLFKLHLWKRVISNTRSSLLQASGTLTLFFEVWFLSSWFVCWLIVHCVPQALNWFPHMFLKFPCVPQHVHNSTSLYFICFVQCCLLWTYIDGPVLGLICFYVWSECSYIGESPKVRNFFVMFQSKRFIAKRNSELGMHPQLINIDHTMVYHDEVSRLSLKIIIKSFQKL